MPNTIKLFAALSAVIHVLIFAVESILWMNPKVYSRFLVQSADHAEVIQLFIVNQGFYNLFLAIGVLIGILMLGRNVNAAKILLAYVSAYMFAAAIVLAITAPALIKGFFLQGFAPFIVLVYLVQDYFRRNS